MKEFTVCITHDVDSLSYRLRARGRGFLNTFDPRAFDPRFNPCRAFQKTLEIEREAGAKATYFFLDFDESSVKTVAEEGAEVALHAEAKTIEDFAKLAEAKKKLEEAAGFKVSGIRQHRYPTVKMDFNKAWPNEKRAGFSYDSSKGLLGLSLDQPFRPANGPLELPVTAIDSGLIYFENNTPAQALQNTKKAIDELAEKKQLFVFLTHLNFICDERVLPGWGGYFKGVVDYCVKKDAAFKTCFEVAKSFRE